MDQTSVEHLPGSLRLLSPSKTGCQHPQPKSQKKDLFNQQDELLMIEDIIS